MLNDRQSPEVFAKLTSEWKRSGTQATLQRGVGLHLVQQSNSLSVMVSG